MDWDEFSNDYDTRAFLQNTIQRLQDLVNELNNAKILHDYDNYQAALVDYDFAKYKAGTTATGGFHDKVSELSQFFTGGNPNGNPK